jgi:phage antirepressor YoqD-like protein
VVRKQRGFHDDEYMLGSYLRKKKLLRKKKKEHNIFTRSHMNLGKCKLMNLADF